MKKYILLILVILTTNGFGETIRISKSAFDKQKTIYFSKVNNSDEYTKLINSDLIRCGWFKVINSNDADYKLTGDFEKGKLVLDLKGEEKDTQLTMIDNPNKALVVHTVVDSILNKVFKIDGICKSKIIFVTEIKKGIKEIYSCDFDGKNVRRLTKSQTISVEPDWLDKNRILYTMYTKGGVQVIQKDLARNVSMRVSVKPGLNSSPSASPDGKSMALIMSFQKNIDLYIKSPIVKGKLLKLTNDRYSESSPCWSPDGKQICFVSDKTGRPKLYLINSNGQNLFRLRTQGREAVSPDWSKNNQLTYSVKLGSNYGIAVLDINKNYREKILSLGAGDWESPSWAPDNRHIVCYRTINRKQELFIIDTWTSKSRKLLDSELNFSLPSWSEN